MIRREPPYFLEHDTTEAVEIGCNAPVCDGAREATTQVFVTFMLGNEEYGIDILSVREIRPYREPTPATDAPPFVKGTVNLRGLVIPIVDLRMKFSLGSIGDAGPTAIIVLNGGEQATGLIVDSVSGIVDVALAARRAAAESGTAMQTEFITGLAVHEEDDGEHILLLLDVERLMEAINIGAHWNASTPAQG